MLSYLFMRDTLLSSTVAMTAAVRSCCTPPTQLQDLAPCSRMLVVAATTAGMLCTARKR